MPAKAPPNYVGLDIAKARLEYTLDEHRTASTGNDAPGHAGLLAWLKAQPNVRVVCEATVMPRAGLCRVVAGGGSARRHVDAA